ncbi:type III-B CRISPR module RAMP protein Cmr1 [Kurthia gibsonii]|uniref:Type III-B CRISPR module RAMP protein Cmr1 n=1 Tax=Kurthia gibsonii TaxID=33946 RepID=A0ABU9LNF6_9BACL
MEKATYKCSVLSTLMSYGNTKQPEIRASEIKALMRYVFRISSVNLGSKCLFKKESEWFGDANTHASPIRLQIIKDTEEEKTLIKEKKLLHKEYNSAKCLSDKTTFELIVRKRSYKTAENVSLKDYTDLLRFATYIGGIGQRNRRGRGSIMLDECLCENKEKLLEFCLNILNKLSGNCFKKQDCEITCKGQSVDESRPTIEKIIVGKVIKKDEMKDFLTMVDLASHKAVKGISYGTIAATGYGARRLASSLLISVVETKDGCIYPVYVFVTPITAEIDNRQDFLDWINTFRDNREVFLKCLKEKGYA